MLSRLFRQSQLDPRPWFRFVDLASYAAGRLALSPSQLPSLAGLCQRLGVELHNHSALSRREVQIVHQVDRKTREFAPPKTARSRRTVPLPNVVSLELAKHMQTYPPAANGLLFHTRDGLPYWHDWYGNKAFKKAALKAKCPAGTTRHDLRHHYASALLAAGESVIAVAERLGHDNAELVLSTYGHLLPNLEDRTRKAVDAAWNGVTEGSDKTATAQGRPQ